MKNDTLNKFALKNAVAVITGAAGLLGKHHAQAILEGGGRAVLTDINEKSLKEITSVLNKFYPKKVFSYPLDVTDEKQIESVVKKITAEVGQIGILINNAANNPKVEDGMKNFSRLENFPIEHWNKDVAVGLTGAFLMSKHIGALMAKNGQGVILNIASDLGIVAPNQELYKKPGLKDAVQPVKPITYSVVKHGLIGLSKYLATYWANKRVRSNAVAFGGVYNNQPDEFVAKLAKHIPLGRMAKPDEYKGVVLFMCSDASSFMTGATVIVDGGRTCW
ncbi:MAG: short-chain dehydrogenase/reductase SDR [Parcubacteria group bacterium Gr01-1014_73]|nr:MAG: short-chain dehydrogenase/reductase SDR [Parcubacteria group bacterium Gr01-1014_73]